MNKLWSKYQNWIIASPVRYFLVALFILTIILICLDYISMFLFWGSIEQEAQDWRSVLTEGHGMWFDILILGVLLSLYENTRKIIDKKKELQKQKQDKIERYLEENDDFRYWHSDEASHRIAGNIKRLNTLGINQFDFTDSYLEKANLDAVNLENSNFVRSQFRNAYLSKVNMKKSCLSFGNFSGCNFTLADLSFSKTNDIEHEEIKEALDTDFTNARFFKANLNGVFFSGIKAWGADFESAKIQKATLRSCYFESASFNSADLKDTDLSNSDLNFTKFRYADLRNTIFINVEFRDIDLESAKVISLDWFDRIYGNGVIALKEKYFVKEELLNDDYGDYYLIALR